MSSGVKRTAAPKAPPGLGPAGKKANDATTANGSGPAPLTYSSGDATDDVNMNEVEAQVTLSVILASGKSASVTVDSNIPMLDLLVHLAARCKVSPSGHVLQLEDPETGKPMDFKPNQTIGSLGATTVHLLPKNKKPEWSKAAKAGKAAKAFEITNRFTINLPGGQKAVMRISPQLTLEQVLARVCQDKSLDPARFCLQHPANPSQPLSLKATVAETRLTEVNLVHFGGDRGRPAADHHRGRAPAPTPTAAPSAAAAPAGSQDPSTWYMPSAGETKKKKGILSFLKKEKKFKLDGHLAETSSVASTPSNMAGVAAQARRPTTPPPERHNSDASRAPRPKTMYATSHPEDSRKGQNSIPEEGEPLVTPRGGGKKRPAPPPPQAKAAAVSGTSDVMQASAAAPVAASAPSAKETVSAEDASTSVAVSVKAGADVAGMSRLHSRNSSDSSGYHELTLSGAESPEASRLPTTFKTSIDTTSIESSDNLNGDSGIQDMSSPGQDNGRLTVPETPSAGSLGQQPANRGAAAKPAASSKKKKAPAPPPPKAAKPAPVQEEAVVEESVQLESGAPGPEMSVSIPDAEDPPPPLTVDVEIPSSADVDVQVKSMPPEEDRQEEPQAESNLPDTTQEEDVEVMENQPSAEELSDADSGEAFNLDDILDGVVFDEEPRREVIKISRPELEEEETDDGDMAMVETSSVVSEDVQVMEDLKSRPCEFIPPPPPDEPPPDNYSPRGSTPRYADKGTVVGEDNSSLAPASLMSSPVSKDEDYTSDVTRFDTEISQLPTSLHLDGGVAASTDTDRSLLENDSHKRDEDSNDDDVVSFEYSALSSAKDPDDVRAGQRYNNAFAMTEEIHAPLETVPPPLQFQTSDPGEEQEEEEEEEEETVITEEYIVPVGPGGLDFSAAVKVGEEERVTQQSQSESVSRVAQSQPPSYSEPQQDSVPQEPEKPAKKEEFVLTMEYLSNVSLVPLRPKMYVPPKTAPISVPPDPEPVSETTMSGSPQRSHVHLAYVSGHSRVPGDSSYAPADTPSLPQASSLASDYVKTDSAVMLDKDQESECESSTDNVYRSTARLKFEANTSGKSAADDTTVEADSAGAHRASITSSSRSQVSAAQASPAAASPGDLQQQYGMLQDQFAVWQRQLQQNEALLVAQSSSASPGNEETLKALQMQMQMQQQMMQQLQMSMQVLALQQRQQGSTQPGSALSKSASSAVQSPPQAPAPAPAPPPPPAPAPSVVKSSKTKPRTRADPSRFQPQLEPREELMIAIRSFGGHGGLNKVPVKATKWTHNGP